MNVIRVIGHNWTVTGVFWSCDWWLDMTVWKHGTYLARNIACVDLKSLFIFKCVYRKLPMPKVIGQKNFFVGFRSAVHSPRITKVYTNLGQASARSADGSIVGPSRMVSSPSHNSVKSDHNSYSELIKASTPPVRNNRGLTRRWDISFHRFGRNDIKSPENRQRQRRHQNKRPQ